MAVTLDQVQTYQASGTPSPQEKSPSVPSNKLSTAIDPYVQRIIASTCGNLYRPLIEHLSRYPIPTLRLPERHGARLLDLGCNWGRWCIAAARQGYQPVGIDPSLEAIQAAQRVSQQCGVTATYLVADARYLPFATASFATVFSYSVLQHFAKPDVRTTLKEVRRVLQPGGTSLIQMPNAYGLHNLWHWVKRGFRPGTGFDVRYWRPRELQHTWGELVGSTTMTVDGYFGLGIQASDCGMLPRRYQVIVRASERLRHWSVRYPRLRYGADSVYLQSTTPRA